MSSVFGFYGSTTGNTSKKTFSTTTLGFCSGSTNSPIILGESNSSKNIFSTPTIPSRHTHSPEPDILIQSPISVALPRTELKASRDFKGKLCTIEQLFMQAGIFSSTYAENVRKELLKQQEERNRKQEMVCPIVFLRPHFLLAFQKPTGTSVCPM